MREVGEYIGSPVQDSGNCEGAPDGQLRDQNEGGRGSPRFQMGGPVVREVGTVSSPLPINHECHCPKM